MGTDPTEQPQKDQKPSDPLSDKSEEANVGAALREIVGVTAKNVYAIAFLSVIVSLLVALVPYILFAIWLFCQGGTLSGLLEFGRAYGLSAMFVLPFLQGLLTGYRVARNETSTFLPSLFILMMNIGVGTLFLHEGALCLVIGFPLFLVFIVVGMKIGQAISRIVKKRTLYAVVLPLAALSFVHDALVPPTFSNAISDTVTVNAPPEAVWRYVVQYPINEKPPEYWLWKIGLPEPIQSIAEARKVGAVRECRFTKNVVFKERITELVPDKVLTFDITEQPRDPEIIGHFSLDKGQILLQPNKDGTTTMIATSWYHLYVSPAFYFDWWAADIVRQVHFRVLNHMKELAEAEASTLQDAPNRAINKPESKELP